MTLTPTSKIGEIAASHPLATRVFARYDIDFCCGGGRALGEACSDRGLDTEQVLSEIRDVVAGASASEQSWQSAPLDELIDHILIHYHGPLRQELPRLETMARKVLRVHGDKDPKRLAELVNVIVGLKAELEHHMMKEERVLFPLIVDGFGAEAGEPVAVMEHEHQEAGAALDRIRVLTDGFVEPAGACNTWRALWHGLADLDRSLRDHIHLENNILFPRALAA